MKTLYVYSFYELDEIKQNLEDAKEILDGNSSMKIPGAKAAIERALEQLVEEDE